MPVFMGPALLGTIHWPGHRPLHVPASHFSFTEEVEQKKRSFLLWAGSWGWAQPVPVFLLSRFKTLFATEWIPAMATNQLQGFNHKYVPT
jgi:hypothetical protein